MNNKSHERSEVSRVHFVNSKDIINIFKDKYFKKYNTPYTSINYGRDGKLIKNKLLKNFSIDQIEKIIEIAINEYPNRWANPKFPRPTIPILCSWLLDQVVAIMDDYEKRTIENEVLEKESEILLDRMLKNLEEF